jgi:hypothetical protein
LLERKHLEALETWAIFKGYQVYITEDGDDTIDFESKTIMIKSTTSIERKIMTLLHECGHILVYENDSLGIRKIASYELKKTKESRVFTVIEEIEAWKRGLKLSKRLGIPIDKKKWNRAVTDAISKYMKWAIEEA